jgi:P4 family phage/plasmid primase-like protien
MTAITDVKSSARNRWIDIFRTIGINDSHLSGKHGPCPKCGGKDRWRVTSNEVGSAICNQCGKFGDGIAVAEWFCDVNTFGATEMIAKQLGIQTEAPKPKRKKKKADQPYWVSQLKWLPSPPKRLVNLWCTRKPPINLEALQRANAKFGYYRSKDSIIALPIFGEDHEEIGYAIYNATGGTLEYYPIPGGAPEFIKIKNLISKGDTGYLGRILPGEGLIVKTEGPTDMLALMVIAPESVSVICNPFGATERPIPWLVQSLSNRPVWTVHDCDEAGQSGALEVESNNRSRPGWATAFAVVASEARNVVLPYEMTHSHGKDLRDWILERLESGLTREQVWEEFLAIAKQSEPLVKEAASTDLIEDIDDPTRLAKMNLDRYRESYGGALKFWKEEWWRYKAGRYCRLAHSEVEAKIQRAVRQEFERDFLTKKAAGEEIQSVKKVTIGLIRNVVAETKSLCLLPGSVRQPSWLEDETQPHWVSMQNGILDLQAIFEGRDNVLLPHSEKWFSATQLEYSYDPKARCERWDEYIEYVMDGDHERISILQEWAGYLLTPTNYLQRFLALYGDGSNGKSVFMGAMAALIGSDNCGHVPLENFSGRFDLGTLVGKVANICGDVGEIDSLAEGILKQFTGGDPMQFDRKNMTPIICKPTAKLIMSFNKPPRIKDRSKGIWRRMCLVPFNRSITAEKIVRHMDQAEYWIDSGEISGILNWAIVGLQRLRDNRDFTKSSVCEEAIDAYRRESNPALDFFDDFVDTCEVGRIRVAHFYKLYAHWCRANGTHPLSSRSLGAEVRKKYGDIKSRNSVGDREYYYDRLMWKVDKVSGEDTCE